MTMQIRGADGRLYTVTAQDVVATEETRREENIRVPAGSDDGDHATGYWWLPA